MSLVVDIRRTVGGFTLDARFEARGGIVALFGPSGSGKTTVIDAVAGLARPDAGRIAVGGATLYDSARGLDLPVHRRRTGYVFQDARLFPHLSVAGNLRYGARFRRGGRPSDPDRVIGLLGLDHLLERRPATLSGGERQRVAIGRALLSDPRILLMDEPLAALDAPRKAEILPYLERLRDIAGLPVIYVSHAADEVARLADTVVLLEDGSVTATAGAAELFSDPVFAPYGAGAVIPGRVAAHDAGDGLTRIDCAAGSLWVGQLSDPPGAPVRIRIAAEDIMLCLDRPERISALNALPVRVEDVQPQDDASALVRVSAGEARLLVRITRRSARAMQLAPGRDLFAIMKSMRVSSADIGHGSAAFYGNRGTD